MLLSGSKSTAASESDGRLHRVLKVRSYAGLALSPNHIHKRRWRRWCASGSSCAMRWSSFFSNQSSLAICPGSPAPSARHRPSGRDSRRARIGAVIPVVVVEGNGERRASSRAARRPPPVSERNLCRSFCAVGGHLLEVDRQPLEMVALERAPRFPGRALPASADRPEAAPGRLPPSCRRRHSG